MVFQSLTRGYYPHQLCTYVLCDCWWTKSGEAVEMLEIKTVSFAGYVNHNINWIILVLLMEEILHQLIGSLSHYLQCFIHPRWLFGISSIKSINLGEGFCPSTIQMYMNHLDWGSPLLSISIGLPPRLICCRVLLTQKRESLRIKTFKRPTNDTYILYSTQWHVRCILRLRTVNIFLTL